MSPAAASLSEPLHAHAPSLAIWDATYADWFLKTALPLWWTHGTDHRRGGFFEKFTQDGTAEDGPRRTRVTARQIYVFTVAHGMGWQGPALSAVQHGLDFLIQRQRKADGTFASAVMPDGTLVDARFDLYEQAFVLFALAKAHAAHPQWAHLPELALQLLDTLRAGWRHPRFGFHESQPPSLPLRSNPHMHLLEAFLAWVDTAPASQRATWTQAAREMVALCMQHLVDPATGAVKEYFDLDWAPMPGDSGRTIEPGHQYEWGWLLLRCSQSDPQSPALRPAAETMIRFAERHGLNDHGVALNELRDDASIKDPQAKLWPQTERIKAWIELARLSQGASRDDCLARAGQACEGLWRYIGAARPGLWQEVMKPDGSFDAQACRASSLYHIVCAIDNLHQYAGIARSPVNTP